MAKASDNEFPSVLFDDQGSTPSTPASGFSRVYTKSDGVYVVDDAGGVTGPLIDTGGGGSGNVSTLPSAAITIGSLALGDRPAGTPGTYDEEFNGTADTLPTNWAWTAAPSGSDAWFLNSRWASSLTVEGTANTTYTLTRSSFTPGTGTFGLWFKLFAGPYIATDKVTMRVGIANSGATEARTINLYSNATTGVHFVRGLKTVASVESTAWGVATPGRQMGLETMTIYAGLTRDGSDSWILWYSTDGVCWNRFAAGETHSFTVDKVVFSIGTSTAQSILGMDWMRSRADLVFPRP